MKDQKINAQIVIKESDIKGEKIIFDISIKDKLAHVIVIKDGQNYHVNLDGEDLGHFTKAADGMVKRNAQHRGAADDAVEYFKVIEGKLGEMVK